MTLRSDRPRRVLLPRMARAPLRLALAALVLLAAALASACEETPEGGEAVAAAPGDRTVVVRATVAGEPRVYRVFEPGSRREGVPAPLVVALHGRSGDGRGFQATSGWDAVARAAGALVAYPDSFTKGWRTGTSPRDVRFLTRLIEDVVDRFRGDPRRVYVTGHSSGAFMSLRMACERADLVAAIGPIAGAPVDDCSRPPARPVPVISIHGTADELIPWAGGVLDVRGLPHVPLPSARTVAARWVRWNGCAPAPNRTEDAQVGSEVWHHCDGGAQVRLLSLEDWSHRYPSRRAGAPIDGARTVWSFVRRYRLPEA